MRRLTLISRFAVGALLANGIPHFIQGVSGRPFPTPFASPPGVGMSPPLANVLWGVANFAVAYVIFAKAKPLPSKFSIDVLLLALGFVLTAVALSQYFG